MRYFGHHPRVRRKADLSPVTEADVAAEEAIVATLRASYPTYALWAEESAAEATATGGPTWIVDPIDGTKQYMRGIPFFATLIALAVGGEPVVGVSYAPALGELLVATRGGGATYNGEPIGVSGLESLDGAFVAFSPLERDGLEAYGDALRVLGRQALGFRGYGDFYGYHLVARGLAEVMIESQVKPWDVAALKVIVEEAGGAYSDFMGDRRAFGTTSAGGSIATNGKLHDEVLRLLHVQAEGGERR